MIPQGPPGPTTHEVWLGLGSGLRTFHKRLSDVHTEDAQTLAVAIEPPKIVDEALKMTMLSAAQLSQVQSIGVATTPGLKVSSSSPISFEGIFGC